MNAMLLMSGEAVAALILAYVNLNIQLRLITFLWAKGCNSEQALDVYDLKDKYKNWQYADVILNLVFIFLFGYWGHPVLGFMAIEAVAMIACPVRAVTSKVAIQKNPNLLDFNGKYKNTCEEYKKLLLLLDEKKYGVYKKSASKLWSELLLLNKRRQEAYENKKKSENIRADVQKLINTYTMEGDTEKRLKAQARLNQLIKQEADIDDFTKQVEERIMMSETVFMEIRTNLATGQLSNILPDLDGYTGKVKALEFTVRQLENN